jgi:hypothetical protein
LNILRMISYASYDEDFHSLIIPKLQFQFCPAYTKSQN